MLQRPSTLASDQAQRVECLSDLPPCENASASIWLSNSDATTSTPVGSSKQCMIVLTLERSAMVDERETMGMRLWCQTVTFSELMRSWGEIEGNGSRFPRPKSDTRRPTSLLWVEKLLRNPRRIIDYRKFQVDLMESLDPSSLITYYMFEIDKFLATSCYIMLIK